MSGADQSEIEGAFSGQGRRFGIVASRFNSRIVDDLLVGARDMLRRHGVAAGDVVVVRVPGAWEIPLALDALARRGGLHGLLALGAVIRGETPHFDVVVQACAGGAGRVQEAHRLPVGMGVLTCASSEQAMERAGGKAGNKGAEAALAVLEMADLLARLGTG
jgi:6,7-dimethyl-8-ribityllumazine synthase